jgi:hypothetical protein
MLGKKGLSSTWTHLSEELVRFSMTEVIRPLRIVYCDTRKILLARKQLNLRFPRIFLVSRRTLVRPWRREIVFRQPEYQ